MAGELIRLPEVPVHPTEIRSSTVGAAFALTRKQAALDQRA